jgi:hypothetical protein
LFYHQQAISRKAGGLWRSNNNLALPREKVIMRIVIDGRTVSIRQRSIYISVVERCTCTETAAHIYLPGDYLYYTVASGLIMRFV